MSRDSLRTSKSANVTVLVGLGALLLVLGLACGLGIDVVIRNLIATR